MEPKGKLIHGLAGDYYQDGELKTCAKIPEHIWMADITYCPYCHMSPEARVAAAEHERRKHGVSRDSRYIPNDGRR